MLGSTFMASIKFTSAHMKFFNPGSRLIFISYLTSKRKFYAELYKLKSPHHRAFKIEYNFKFIFFLLVSDNKLEPN